MVTAYQHGTEYPGPSGVNPLQAPGRLDLQAHCSKVPLGSQSRIHLKRVTSNTVVVLCAIATLLVLIVFLELHIRTLTSIAAPATSRGERTLEGSSRVAASYMSDGQDQVSGPLA